MSATAQPLSQEGKVSITATSLPQSVYTPSYSTLITIAQHNDATHPTITTAHPALKELAVRVNETPAATTSSVSTSIPTADPNGWPNALKQDLIAKKGYIGGTILVIIVSILTVAMMALLFVSYRWLHKPKNNLQPGHPNWHKMRDTRGLERERQRERQRGRRDGF